MAVYLSLVLFIILLPVVTKRFFPDDKKRNQVIAMVGMTAIFLLLALKGNVGADIQGYRVQYEASASKQWSDTDYVYFETGYVYLMMAFSKLGIGFQGFIACCYAFACSVMYCFIKRYSVDSTFSILVFICYQFLVFYISGIRQMIAMSICLLAYLISQRRRIWAFLLAFLLNYFAYMIHTSAIVFVAVLFFNLFKNRRLNIALYLVMILGAILARPYVWEFVNRTFRRLQLDTPMNLGGNFIFTIAIAVMMYFINPEIPIFRVTFAKKTLGLDYENNGVFFTKMVFLSIIALILFSGHSMGRATMYFSIFSIVGLPNSVAKLETKAGLIVKWLLILFFIGLFILETLIPNQLQLRPYEFFWS